MLLKGSIFHRLINKYWVSSHYVPVNPVAELQLDLSRPIIYLVAQNSASDLLELQSCCLQAGLPDPYCPITVDGQNLCATIFIHDGSLSSAEADQPQLQDAPYLVKYQQLLALHRMQPNLDIQLLPVTFYWGRNPGKQGKKSYFDTVEQHPTGSLHKTCIVLKNGKDHLLRFNKPISIAALRHRHDQQKNSQDQPLAHKLAKIALTYFANQKRYSIGPKLPNRSAMIAAVLQQPLLRKTITSIAEESNGVNSRLSGNAGDI